MSDVREYNLGMPGTDGFAKASLQMHIDTLENFRYQHPPGTVSRKELEWEIAVYRYMQADPEPAKRLREYQHARFDENHIPGPKREAIAKLGWVIPEVSGEG